MDLTIIIPTYRNSKYLDLCLKSATENMAEPDTKIMVIVDGFAEESEEVLKKYSGIYTIALPSNFGMGQAINMGVWNSNTQNILVVNDDNVFPTEWDKRLSAFSKPVENNVITINQIEPESSIFGFPVVNLGKDISDFRYEEFLEIEKTVSNGRIDISGKIFPFMMSKRNYMKIGGFDTFYQSPFWIDVDFWLKLELCENVGFIKTHSCHLYHFGSKATKSGPEGEKFRVGEQSAAQQFMYKWGFLPNVVANVQRRNTKIPENSPKIRGIQF